MWMWSKMRGAGKRENWERVIEERWYVHAEFQSFLLLIDLPFSCLPCNRDHQPGSKSPPVKPQGLLANSQGLQESSTIERLSRSGKEQLRRSLREVNCGPYASALFCLSTRPLTLTITDIQHSTPWICSTAILVQQPCQAILQGLRCFHCRQSC